jgi:hypothetical protein
MPLLDPGSARLRRLAGMTDGAGHCKPARIRREVPLEES